MAKAIIEIVKGSNVKYEINSEYNLLEVSRFPNTPINYPFNYGYFPNTLSEDGDPLDVVLICSRDIIPNCIIDVKPIGVLYVEDQDGKDPKIICIPSRNIDLVYSGVVGINDLNSKILEDIIYFFEHYKDLEPNKWAKVSDLIGSFTEAQRELDNSIERWRNK